MKKRCLSMVIILIALIILSLSMSACVTVIPDRFTQIPDSPENGGYFIEAEYADGYHLEVFYVSYSFSAQPDRHIQEARSYFVKVAQFIAQKRTKAIEPVVKSQLLMNTTRNEANGDYTSYVSGRVKYAH